MKWTKRFFGVLTAVLGAAGVAACVVGIVAAWNVRTRLDETTAHTFDRVDVALTGLAERAKQINERLRGLRESVGELNDRVQQRIAKLRDEPMEDAPDLDQLERQLYVGVQQTRDWLGFMQATVELVEQLLKLMESTSAWAQHDTRTTQDAMHSLRAGYEETHKTSKLVADARRELGEIRDRENVDESAAQIETLSSRIAGSLGRLVRFGEEFEAGVIGARTRIGNLGERIRWRIFVAAMVCTLLLLWMGFAQLSLVLLGRRMLLARRPSH